MKNFARECETIAEKFLASDALEKFAVDAHEKSKKKIIAAHDATAPQNKIQQKISTASRKSSARKILEFARIFPASD